jgi:hypothetical protein
MPPNPKQGPRSWLGALLAPAEDPRLLAQPASPDTARLLADLRRSRCELSELRSRLEAQAADLQATERARVEEQVQEVVLQEQELLRAEQSLSLSVDERHAQEMLERARLRTVEAELYRWF